MEVGELGFVCLHQPVIGPRCSSVRGITSVMEFCGRRQVGTWEKHSCMPSAPPIPDRWGVDGRKPRHGVVMMFQYGLQASTSWECPRSCEWIKRASFSTLGNISSNTLALTICSVLSARKETLNWLEAWQIRKCMYELRPLKILIRTGPCQLRKLWKESRLCSGRAENEGILYCLPGKYLETAWGCFAITMTGHTTQWWMVAHNEELHQPKYE